MERERGYAATLSDSSLTFRSSAHSTLLASENIAAHIVEINLVAHHITPPPPIQLLGAFMGSSVEFKTILSLCVLHHQQLT